MSKTALSALLLGAFALVLPNAARADPQQNCMLTYFKTRSSGCVGEIVALAGRLPANARGPSNNIVGFLGELFRGSPREKDRILAAEADRDTRAVEVAALFRAGLNEDADRLAAASGLSDELARWRSTGLPIIAQARPARSPGENDVLIGAYSASGDRGHLVRILDNFNGLDQAVAADAIRLALLMGKFGGDLAPKWRNGAVMRNACEKYLCKANSSRLMRLLTLSSGLWSLRALARDDEAVRATLNAFFSRHPQLNKLLLAEQNAFGNYLTIIIALQTLNDPQSREQNPQVFEAMSRSADAYERLEPAAAALQPMSGLKKPG